ncbi:heme NO-binding domain-containing protein [Phaeovulum sp.]|uniref:heme NO-binding domain-containing protein n=1 Tax=Phaeovulum sp. TaxID=2934796 RepID=UPI0027322B0C|nr:heme NO-binding domain-containing protein [Phaeovulum sp.]MDP1667433.1 heme NO-binding domain-containing protein [Phaeovulum sp.]MDP2064326.1 heme NO-binding domain-containing protein [Phaeovulum sp.]MDP3861095.1 heme NO-binding domain-containing protein [Phaeovulum sp.]MDZ4119950.1 heme NO-binding domain-containing protein [Phaeovulum sp.]
MHGLINRSIQRFLRDTYGPELWQTVAEAAAVPAAGFEAMLQYDDALTAAMLRVAADRLGKPQEALLEDLGTYLVTLEPLRRLLRFGGVDYADFLMSLEELPARGRMALPELDLPQLALAAAAEGRLVLMVRAGVPGWGLVLSGLLRAMADDYGALALIELGAAADGQDRISVDLLDSRFASGRRFELAQPVAL